MDFMLNNHGSICTLTPLTVAGEEWMGEHIPDDAQMWGRNGVVIEPRYVADIVDGIQADGLQFI